MVYDSNIVSDDTPFNCLLDFIFIRFLIHSLLYLRLVDCWVSEIIDIVGLPTLHPLAPQTDNSLCTEMPWSNRSTGTSIVDASP